MTEDTTDPDAPEPPQVERRRRLSVVWIVPLIAALVGLGLFVRHVLQTGPEIEIEFRTAESLEAGKTELRYKEVPVGRVERVALSADRQRVLVSVRLDRGAASMAVADSRFWVVRPRIGTAGVSGLGTLLSGAYIGVDAGVSAESKHHFTGLEVPPFVLRNEPGRSFTLTATDLGSLDIGSPVFYRRIRVGRVVGYALDPSLDQLTVQVFIESPHEHLVTTQSRFWNASGLDLSLSAAGLKLNTQSLVSVIAGGVAFANAPSFTASAPEAAEGTRFTLFNDRQNALAPPDGPPLPVRMVFAQDTRGLAVGAPLDVLGVEVGRVSAITLQHDAARQRFAVEAVADLHPHRLGLHGQPGIPDDDRRLMKLLVERGLRAQLRTGNLFTGQMYIALDFPAQAASAPAADARSPVLTLPTVPSEFGALQPRLVQIVKRLSEVHFDEIGHDLQDTLRAATSAIHTLTPQAQKALSEVEQTLQSAQRSLAQIDRNISAEDAPLQRHADATLQELQRAANALRVLADYLQRHPEAVLRGKPADEPGGPR